MKKKKYSNDEWKPIMERAQIEKECDALRQELYPDPNEYPFQGEYEGYPARVVIEFVKHSQNSGTLGLLHRRTSPCNTIKM